MVLLTAGVGEVDDVAVLLEHVNLLNALDRLDVHLLQGSLELLVIGTAVPLDLLDLAAGSTLATKEITCQSRSSFFSFSFDFFHRWIMVLCVGKSSIMDSCRSEWAFNVLKISKIS